ncbi:MAG TPA: hypothetical protein VN088_16230 [Nocardioides sp.]|nr:hypothetical protein [Nocardioides sp.]
MAYSSLPAVVDALVASLAALPALAGVLVEDGPDRGYQGGSPMLLIGSGATQTQGHSATGDFAAEGFGSQRRDLFTLDCTVKASAPTPSLARSAAFGVLDSVVSALPSLEVASTLSIRATGSWSLAQEAPSFGSLAELTFPITVDGYTD